jgi:RNA polymerase sigma-70 factor (ECF subfamily)
LNSIKNLLMLSARQRKLCKRLESDRGRLFRMAYAWSQNQDVADEVVQQTMIKAMHGIDKVRNIDAIDSWLFRMLSNCFIDLCRRRREEVDVDDVVLFEQDTPETIHLQNEMLISVRSAIACLPVKHRQVITLIDIESFSYAEVACILDIPQGTVMSRLNRARQSLKKILSEPTKENNKTLLKVVR